MQTELRGIICCEFLGTNDFRIKDVEEFLNKRLKDIRPVLVRGTASSFIYDAFFIIFHNCEQGYKSFKYLTPRWIDEKKGLTSPILYGSRISLHVGISSYNYDSEIRFTIELAKGYELMKAGAPNTVLISAEAYHIVKQLIVSDHLPIVSRSFNLRDWTNLEAYEISIDEFLKPDQYLIRIEPPTDLMLYLALNPEFLYKISPRKFEEVIAELFSEFGYTVELTKQTRDKGIDIIAIRRNTPLKLSERYLVQCKRNAPKNKVCIAIVHDLLGVGVEEPNTGLILATTSTFTIPALNLAKKETVRWRLHLKDYKDLQEWLFEYYLRRKN